MTRSLSGDMLIWIIIQYTPFLHNPRIKTYHFFPFHTINQQNDGLIIHTILLLFFSMYHFFISRITQCYCANTHLDVQHSNLLFPTAHPQLRIHQTVIDPLLFQQFVVGTDLGNAVLVDHHQPVRIPQGGQAVSDGKGGSALYQAV